MQGGEESGGGGEMGRRWLDLGDELFGFGLAALAMVSGEADGFGGGGDAGGAGRGRGWVVERGGGGVGGVYLEGGRGGEVVKRDHVCLLLII